MYVLRRIRLPSRNALRIRSSADHDSRRAMLRGADKRLAEALQQISSGVPLNWGQIEDDPELATLALLDEAARECRRSAVGRVPPEVRLAILEKLEKSLPDPKPKQAKAAPKALAGFSENVTVLTQADEDVPSLISNAPQWIAATSMAGLVVAAVLWVISTQLFPVHLPKYDWIEVRQAGKPVTAQQQVKSKTLPSCQGFDLADPTAKRKFIRLPDDKQQLPSAVGFPVQFLPRSITTTINITPGTPEHQPTPLALKDGATRVLTYMFFLSAMQVAPCITDNPDPSDHAEAVRLTYQARSGIQGDAAPTAALAVFQVREQPVFLDATNGSWEEARGEGWHGVYWQGALYRDIEGIDWRGETSVLIFERNGTVTTLVGESNHRVTKEVLTILADKLSHAPASQPSP